jgi:GNAT superfamily N-acetyltransferase
MDYDLKTAKPERPIVRCARVSDAAAVHAILKAARRDIPITAADFDSERYLDWARGECRQRRFWVAEIKDQIAGVMLLRADEVFYLVTAEEYQRSGVATALLAYAKKTHQLLTTKTKPCNHRTLALLEREGFRFVDEDSDWKHFEWRRGDALRAAAFRT